MEVILDKKSTTEASLSVKIVPEDYNEKVTKALKDTARKAHLKGFRPGKVPPQVIQKMYGKSILLDEVNEILAKTVSDYIRDNKLSVVGDPMIDREKTDAIDWKTQKEFEFSYDLGLASDFEVDFAALPSVNSYSILSGQKELDETIDNLTKQFGEQIHAEVSEEGDMIYGELKQGDFNTKTAIPFARLKDEAKAKFIGVAKGGTIAFDIRDTFENDRAVEMISGLKTEEAAALNGEFELVVEDITRRGVSELNQEFFDKVLMPGQVENVEDFKTKVAEIIQENYNRESGVLLSRNIEDSLLNNINIELPTDFLKKWLLQINEGKVSAETIDAEFDMFARSLKWSLIKQKIAEKAEIKVEYADVQARSEAMVRQQFGQYLDQMGERGEEFVKNISQNYLTEDGKTDNFSKLYNEIQDERTLDYCKGNFKLDPKEIDVEEFKAIVEALATN